MEADISQVDFAVIDILKTDQRISCKELANIMKLSTSRCSRVVDRLLQKGYVVRRQNVHDRRAVEVSLTAKGKRLKKNIGKLKTRCNEKIFGAIEPKDVDIVRKGMRILRKSLRLS